MTTQDYSQTSLNELRLKEKELKRNETISRFFTGLLVGVAIYGIAANGFKFLYLFLLGILMYGNHKQSQKQKNERTLIQQEISARHNSGETSS